MEGTADMAAGRRAARLPKAAEEWVRRAAYGIWEARAGSGRPGDELSDWLEAEAMLREFEAVGRRD